MGVLCLSAEGGLVQVGGRKMPTTEKALLYKHNEVWQEQLTKGSVKSIPSLPTFELNF